MKKDTVDQPTSITSITANCRPVSPIRSASDHKSDVFGKMEAQIDKITGSDEIDPADVELYETYRTQVQYEMRKGRFSMFRRLEDITNVMLDNLEAKLMSGEDINITPSQMRLYFSMFLDQTRSEFDPKGTVDVLIDQRQQTINVIEVEKTYDNGRTIDIQRD